MHLEGKEKLIVQVSSLNTAALMYIYVREIKLRLLILKSTGALPKTNNRRGSCQAIESGDTQDIAPNKITSAGESDSLTSRSCSNKRYHHPSTMSMIKEDSLV